MNAAQYKIVKTMVSFPMFDTKKFARMIKVDHAVVLKVQRTNSFEQFESDDSVMDDLFGGMFGGKNPFGGGL